MNTCIHRHHWHRRLLFILNRINVNPIRIKMLSKKYEPFIRKTFVSVQTVSKTPNDIDLSIEPFRILWLGKEYLDGWNLSGCYIVERGKINRLVAILTNYVSIQWTVYCAWLQNLCILYVRYCVCVVQQIETTCN